VQRVEIVLEMTYSVLCVAGREVESYSPLISDSATRLDFRQAHGQRFQASQQAIDFFSISRRHTRTSRLFYAYNDTIITLLMLNDALFF